MHVTMAYVTRPGCKAFMECLCHKSICHRLYMSQFYMSHPLNALTVNDCSTQLKIETCNAAALVTHVNQVQKTTGLREHQ